MKLVRKLLLAVFILVIIAVLLAPAWYFYQHPEALLSPTPVAASASGLANLEKPLPFLSTGGLSPVDLSDAEPPVAEITPDAVAVLVEITVQSVNLRKVPTGVASGEYLYQGALVMVVWDASNYGVIVSPEEYQDLMVWRGCTSDPAGLGCEAK